jgi:hypothetical protein
MTTNNDDDKDEEKNKKPKVVEKNIRLAGDKDSCGHCLEGDKFFSEYAPKTGANYQYYHIESDKGKQIAENLDAGPNGGIPIPAIEYCKTVEDPTKGGEKKELCDYVEGFNKNDWSDKLDYKKPNDVDDEIDELFGEND